MAVEETLGEFRETAGNEPFALQGSKMLKVQLQGETIEAKLGSMVAYQGDVSSSTPARAASSGWRRRPSPGRAPS